MYLCIPNKTSSTFVVKHMHQNRCACADLSFFKECKLMRLPGQYHLLPPYQKV